VPRRRTGASARCCSVGPLAGVEGAALVRRSFCFAHVTRASRDRCDATCDKNVRGPMISCVCPACGKVFRAKEDAVGKEAKCRQCGHFFVAIEGPHTQNSRGVEAKPTSIPNGLTTHAESDAPVGGNPTERRSRQSRTRPDQVFATSQSFAAQDPPPLPGAAIMSPSAATRRCTTEAAAEPKPRSRRARDHNIGARGDNLRARRAAASQAAFRC
jgi:DNA-directed RNA polymerase subunit RPC12/RpoP